MSTSAGPYQALVFGAPGISGLAITRSAVLAKEPHEFTNVIGLTSRLLSVKDSVPDDPKLELRVGLDLTKGTDAVKEFSNQIEGIENTTHIYFLDERTESILSWGLY